MRYRYCGPLVLALVVSEPATANAQLVLFPHLDARLAGDVEPSRGGAGIALGYQVPVWRGLGLGLELDAAWHGHFFRDEDVAHLVPEGVDLNTDALLLMGRLVLPVSIPRAPIWRPYGSIGLGLIHAVFTVPGDRQYDAKQNDLALAGGVGMMHQLTRLLALRAEAQYTHAVVDGDASGGYAKDYGFWAVSVGVAFQLPLQRWADRW